ncbi:sigma-70 family RNA polymerase sigma factor [Kitasatospora sp. NPDC057965]|uniref:sigma-70 family RNA polymerase sigma factor n=1 Tax=Kitasatospora sp. NPDC057965 TaxID=3346291 RepID=UPI0036DA1822
MHCYRMLRSYDEAEDLVQEALLRVWRYRASFRGRSSLPAWLYRIATNACLDFLDRHPRRPKPGGGGRPAEVAWLQPFPDRLLEPVAAREAEPEAVVVARETVELAFVVAVQHLPPRQRAVLLLRDVLGWSAVAPRPPSSPTGAGPDERGRPALRARWRRARRASGSADQGLFQPGDDHGPGRRAR